MTFLIIHGIGGHSGIHWQAWLSEQLTKQGHRVIMPEMPRSDHPDRGVWLSTIIEVVNDVSEQLVIVGHSLGVTTALDYIGQLDNPIHGLVSVAGFASDYGAELNSYFLKVKQIDFEKVRLNVKKTIVFYGNDDPYVTQAALKEVAEKLQAKAYIINKGGHLNTDSGYSEFDQLLGIINNEM